VNPPPTVTIFSPAKINLFLAVTGRRADDYHDLVSVVAPLTFGDELTARAGEGSANAAEQFRLECDDPAVPLDGTNLVLKAAVAFAAATGWTRPVAFRLIKRVPMAAGLGGGSSNAVAALVALNRLSGTTLDRAALAALAAQIGSDCPVFLEGAPAVMRGRGERVEALPAAAARRLRGRRVLVFKPSFGVGTPWAYAQLALASARPGPASTMSAKPESASAAGAYLPVDEAERRLARWIGGEAPAEDLLFNSFESVVFRKFIALPTLLGRLRERFGLAPLMSGSGSACFALLPDGAPVEAIAECIREAWGDVSFVQSTTIA